MKHLHYRVPIKSQMKMNFVVSVVTPSPNPQAGGSSLVGCSAFLIQHIGSYSAKSNKVSPPPSLNTSICSQ